MSDDLQEIVEAATDPLGWPPENARAWDNLSPDTKRFVLTFNPERVSQMLAVVEVARKMDRYVQNVAVSYDAQAAHTSNWNRLRKDLREALAALDAAPLQGEKEPPA